MIQSGKFDSFKMDIKKLANSVLDFTIKRLIEITGIIILFVMNVRAVFDSFFISISDESNLPLCII